MDTDRDSRCAGSLLRWISAKGSSARRGQGRRASVRSALQPVYASKSTSTTSLNCEGKCSESETTECRGDERLQQVERGSPKSATESPEQQVSLANRKSVTQQGDLDQVLLGLLECPVCYQHLTPPVRQCANGHCVCALCHHKLVSCPTCRGCFLAATNPALNAIAGAVWLPCSFRAQGCAVRLRLADKALHEASCTYRVLRCPDVAAACAWKGCLTDLLLHTLSDHARCAVRVSLNQYVEMGYTYSRSKPFEISAAKGGVSDIARSIVLVDGPESEVQATAVALFVFHVRFDATRTVLQTVLQLVGPPSLAALLSYKVMWSSSDGGFRISAWSSITSETFEQILAGGRVLRVEGDAFQHFLNPEGKFRVRIKLVANRLPQALKEA